MTRAVYGYAPVRVDADEREVGERPEVVAYEEVAALQRLLLAAARLVRRIGLRLARGLLTSLGDELFEQSVEALVVTDALRLERRAGFDIVLIIIIT